MSRVCHVAAILSTQKVASATYTKQMKSGLSAFDICITDHFVVRLICALVLHVAILHVSLDDCTDFLIMFSPMLLAERKREEKPPTSATGSSEQYSQLHIVLSRRLLSKFLL